MARTRRAADLPVAETRAERFERLCLALDMAQGLDRDEAYPILMHHAKSLPRRSKLAKWYLGRCLSTLGDLVPPG